MNRRLLISVHLPLLLTAMFWGTNFVALKRILEHLTVADTLVVRSLLAALCNVVLLLVLRRSNVPIVRADMPRVFLVAILGGVLTPIPNILAQRYITASVASLLATTNALWTALFAWLILSIGLTRRKIVGMGVAFLGFLIILLLGGPSVSFSARNTLGVLIFVLSPLSWGLYSVLAKPLLARYPSMQLVAVTTIVGTVFLLPILVSGTPGRVAHLSGQDWLLLLWVGVITLWLAYVFWFRGLRALQPSQVAVYIYLVPCFGVIAARVFLNEPITLFVLIGGATILSGVIITNSPSRAERIAATAPVVATPASPHSFRP
ncbi:MAG: DMT family transporter [Chloroflexota bacterium]|nr:DMT family transporter [Chloroflexota bacterium]MDQ6908197.1 DMT family transporter [Chloroflexota bacterium]